MRGKSLLQEFSIRLLSTSIIPVAQFIKNNAPCLFALQPHDTFITYSSETLHKRKVKDWTWLDWTHFIPINIIKQQPVFTCLAPTGVILQSQPFPLPGVFTETNHWSFEIVIVHTYLNHNTADSGEYSSVRPAWSQPQSPTWQDYTEASCLLRLIPSDWLLVPLPYGSLPAWDSTNYSLMGQF